MVFTYHAEDFYATVLADGNLSYKNKVFTSLFGFGSYFITLIFNTAPIIRDLTLPLKLKRQMEQ